MSTAPAIDTSRNGERETGAGSPLRRNWVWFTLQVAMRIVSTVWLRYRAKGLEHVPATGGALFLANHQSYLDPLLIGLPLRRPVSYLARHGLFNVPVIGWILRNTYVMPIEMEGNSLAGIRATLRRIQAGFLVGIFPEGSRSLDGTVDVMKPGFAALARRVDLPIIPVGVAGAHRALRRGSWFLSPNRVCVVFGEPLPADELAPLRERGQEDAFVAYVREQIIACVHEAEAWLHRGDVKEDCFAPQDVAPGAAPPAPDPTYAI